MEKEGECETNSKANGTTEESNHSAERSKD